MQSGTSAETCWLLVHLEKKSHPCELKSESTGKRSADFSSLPMVHRLLRLFTQYSNHVAIAHGLATMALSLSISARFLAFHDPAKSKHVCFPS